MTPTPIATPTPAEHASYRVVRQLIQALAIWDTEGMVRTQCPEIQQQVRDALQSGGALIFGLGLLAGIAPSMGQVRNLQITPRSLGNRDAILGVSADILYGPPLGTYPLHATLKLRNNGGAWCIYG